MKLIEFVKLFDMVEIEYSLTCYNSGRNRTERRGITVHCCKCENVIAITERSEEVEYAYNSPHFPEYMTFEIEKCNAHYGSWSNLIITVELRREDNP